MSTSEPRSIAVVGGGITGLTAAYRLVQARHTVTVFEPGPLGGKLQASRFAGIDGLDSGPDAILARVPWGTALLAELGLTDLVSPATGKAFVAHRGRLHDIPDGLVLGVPAGIGGLARSRLLSWPGKVRAALDVVLPARPTAHDSLGRLIRERFGAEVLELLVDPLVGGINAGDSDDLSLRASTPQIAPVAERSRSLLLGLRTTAASTPKASASPIFVAPRGGTAALPAKLIEVLTAAGVSFRSTAVGSIEPDANGVVLDGERFDGVILAVPAPAAASLLAGCAPQTARGLSDIVMAGVVMVTVHVTDPAALRALPQGSGVLVPKPDQMHLTAASLASRKWAHWSPASGEVVRLSLGRHGNQAPLGFDDDTCVTVAMKELAQHLGHGHEITPAAARVTRWPAAFPQYQPHHFDRVGVIEAEAAREVPLIALAGASYRGVGIPACIRQAQEAVTLLTSRLADLAE
jgi:oxygen-dependent protoporphyrinogen oxidase